MCSPLALPGSVSFWRVDNSHEYFGFGGFIAVVDNSEFDLVGSFRVVDVSVYELRFDARFLAIEVPLIRPSVVAEIQLVVLNLAVAIGSRDTELHW